jgi:hypothetical protein
MLLRRTAVTLTGLGLMLTVGATPAAAHEGHGHASPGQNKDLIPLVCDGIGAFTVEVTSANKGRGVGRIVEGGKGVLIPVSAVFTVRDADTGEVFDSGSEVFAPGQQNMATTTCTVTFFEGTLAEVDAFDPEFASFLREAGVDENDVIIAQSRIQALLRGQVAR